MRSLFFMSLLCLAASPIVAQKANSPIEFNDVMNMTRLSHEAPTITPDRPDGPVIRGAGTIKFDFDPADFPVDANGTAWLPLELGFGAGGELKHCLQFGYRYGYSSTRQPAEEQFCKIARNKLRFDFNPKYQLDAPMGYLAANVTWSKRLFPAKPYRLSRNATGVRIEGMVEKSRGGKATGCTIWSDGLLPSEKSDICAMLVKSPQFNAGLAAASKRSSVSGKTFTVWLAAATPAPTVESYVEMAETDYDSPPRTYIYPSSVPKDVPSLFADIGQFFLTLQYSERTDLHQNIWDQARGKASLALVIAPDGSVLSCTPHRGSDDAGLDLKACELAKSRGRFVFTSGVRIEKPHLYIAPVEWPAPKY